MDKLQGELERLERYKELAELMKPVIERRELERNETKTISVRHVPFNNENEFTYSTYKLHEDPTFPYEIISRSHEDMTVRVYRKYNALN